MTTPAHPSLFDRAKAWFEAELNQVKNFREHVDPHKGLLLEAVQALHELEARVAAVEATVAKDAPVAEELVKGAEVVTDDVAKAVTAGG